MSKGRVKELEQLIEQYSHQYYIEGQSEVSDAEFDDLADELRQLSPGSEVLKRVGAKPSNTVWPEVKHEIHMGSQLKVNTFEEFREWADKIGVTEFCWSEKLDGSSLAVHYDASAKLTKGYSRGDGTTGSDITANVVQFARAKLGTTATPLWVRGEVIMTKATFNDRYAGVQDPESGRVFKNARNTAAGLVRRLSGKGCADLELVCYGLESDAATFATEQQKFGFLEDRGLRVPAYGVVKSLEEAKKVYDGYVKRSRDACGYEIDGLIFAVNDITKQKALGMVDNRPKGQRAWKFPPQEKTSRIAAVVWQTGRTGRITPVAEIDPVDIGGVTVSRVSLMNRQEIARLGIGVGDSVVVTRCNDVIPRITRKMDGGSSTKIGDPSACPSCGHKTEGDGAYVICPAGDRCPAQSTAHLLNFLRVIDVKGFGESMIEELKSLGILSTPLDFYTLTSNDFSSAKIGKKLCDEIKRKGYEMTLPVFVDALGIHGIGQHATELAMGRFPTLEALQEAEVHELNSIQGIGPEIAVRFVSGLSDRRPLIEALQRHVKIREPGIVSIVGAKCAGWVAIFTGFRDDDLESFIRRQGGEVVSSMSKRVTHVVAKDAGGSSSKLKKAREAGLRVLSKDELESLVG